MLISVVIPTLNRPALMLEAVESVARQTYGDWEVVLVDDGSIPPVDRNSVAALVGDRLQIVRHPKPCGVPAAKNAGLRASRGEIITYLDDDDLLAEGALAAVAQTFAKYPQLDCVFLNVEPFGRFASGSAENQALAMSKLMQRVAHRDDDAMVFFGAGLFEALVKSVPLPLQRPAARRGAWNIVGEYTTGLFFSEPDWTIRASMYCKMALLRTPLYRWRCDGQNFASRPEMLERAVENGLRAAQLLAERLDADYERYRRYRRLGRQFLADAYFGRAYFSFTTGGKRTWDALSRSFCLSPGWKHLSLGLRNLKRASRKIWDGVEPPVQDRGGKAP